ncbi:MAG TPA: hypothetical protein DCY27_04775 [Desulfobacterales bacterium]|nr:hypothetical protein [Desulfobacterales bacterium]
MAGWVLFTLLGMALLGCGAAPPPEPGEALTYTLDAQTQELLEQLNQSDAANRKPQFGRRVVGLFIPGAFLPFEPFVLGLATESPAPTVLLLDAPWVHRYAGTHWLYELEETGVFTAKKLVPVVAEAFSVKRFGAFGGGGKELMAAPNSIKGNILFFRHDLLTRYGKSPPRNWDELVAICRDILPREKSLKYGLIFHATNFINDFYPIFWGFGGRVYDEEGNIVFFQPHMLAKAEAALAMICSMQGTLAPGPAALKDFEAPESLRQAFLRGEALFMINWNTRLHDLKEMLNRPEWRRTAAIANMDQIGVAPIPSQTGQSKRFSNIGSFGWGVNRFAITRYGIMEDAKQFINMVVNDRIQVLAAENSGQIPSLQTALSQVRNPEVLRVFDTIFSYPGVVLQPRPKSRRFNNTLEKYLLTALSGRSAADAAIKAAAQELKQHISLD